MASVFPELIDPLEVENYDNPDAVRAILAIQNAFYGLLTQGAGAPVNGVDGSGAGFAKPGGLYLDTTNKRSYINLGTTLSPSWRKQAIVNGSGTES